MDGIMDYGLIIKRVAKKDFEPIMTSPPKLMLKLLSLMSL